MSASFRFRLVGGLLTCACLLNIGSNPARGQSPPPLPVPFAVSLGYPTNGQAFLAPATIWVRALVTDSNAVQTVQYFSGTSSLGIVTNTGAVSQPGYSTGNPFYLAWSNVPAGKYTLTAVATDSAGLTATSAPVNITVTNPPPVPFAISFWYPTNGQTFLAPATIGVHAQVTDSNVVQTVQYFSGSTSIGIVTNTRGVLLTNLNTDSPFYMAWSNVPAVKYTLTAVATDSAGLTATSAPVNISVTNRPPPVVPFAVSFWYPTNGQTFLAPATIGVHAQVTDSNVVQTVQYFSGATSIGIVTNTKGVLLTNTSTGNPFFLAWSNVPAGKYTLTAVATDSAGLTATSAPVNISVTNPPPVPFAVSLGYPTNGQTFLAPATIWVRALVTDSNAVQTVQYFSGTSSIGIVTNTGGVLQPGSNTGNPFYLEWSNVPAGKYTLTAVATDSAGLTATSAPVNISVTNRPPPVVPFAVSLWYPTNGQTFLAPATIGVHAQVTDSNVVQTVQYFSGATSIGVVTNTKGVLLTNTSTGNPFYMAWSNVPAGKYTLTAVATDSAGLTATSAPINISVTNPPPVPFAVSLGYPTNGQAFLAPATIGVHAQVTDSNVVQTVQYFSGATSIGVVTNTKGVLLTNTSTGNPFYMAWSNVPAGKYTLTVVATDSAGLTATSAPINISVTNPPPVPFAVSLGYPTNGQAFLAPATIWVRALVTDSNAVQTVQYFSGTSSIGIVTNTGGVLQPGSNTGNPFYLAWSNVPAGKYTLTAVATDSAGLTATSAPVNISVTNRPPPVVPFAVSFWYPTNGQTFLAPATIGVHAQVTDSNVVQTVQYFSGATSIGIVTNTKGVLLTNTSTGNPFFLAWSNVPAGKYTLTAVATDSAGLTATSAPINISVTNPPPVPFAVSLGYPTNGQAFLAPATIWVRALVTDSNAVQTVQYFSGTSSIGIVTNTGGVLQPGSNTGNPFYLAWSNVPAGKYTLTAVATDSAGLTATSAPVNITVTNPPPVPFAVSFWYPTNSQTFQAPATIGVHAQVTDSNVVQTVQYFSGATSIGIVTNTKGVLLTNTSTANPFFMAWSNVPAGKYTLTAVATDSAGLTATSAPVNISVTNPPPVPFAVSFWYPTNGQTFLAPATIGVHAQVTDSNVVQTVQYFSGTTSIGIVTNGKGVLLTNKSTANPFFMAWSNVPAGNYALTAVATDSAGLTATSAPVNIFVVTNLPPSMSIYAPDPVAVEGTNTMTNWFGAAWITNYSTSPSTATFLVQRDSGTNTDQTVYFSIGGTASNGVDYAAIPNSVTIPAGQRHAQILIVPLNDKDSAYRLYDTVVLALTAPVPANAPPPYLIGSPASAGAIILEENLLPIVPPTVQNLSDNSIQVSLPAANGTSFSLQTSADLVNWLPVCTNTVLKGSVQFIDPNGGSDPSKFYRIVPAAPADY